MNWSRADNQSAGCSDVIVCWVSPRRSNAGVDPRHGQVSSDVLVRRWMLEEEAPGALKYSHSARMDACSDLI